MLLVIGRSDAIRRIAISSSPSFAGCRTTRAARRDVCATGSSAPSKDEDSFIAVEEWEDREALDRHFAEPHLHDFTARLLELVSERPEVAIHEISGTSEFPGWAP